MRPSGLRGGGPGAPTGGCSAKITTHWAGWGRLGAGVYQATAQNEDSAVTDRTKYFMTGKTETSKITKIQRARCVGGRDY